MKKLRLAVVGALVASAGLMFPTGAQATPTYWQFQNARFNTCLTAGNNDNVFATTCVFSDRQQWDWVGSYGNYSGLRNLETDTCLTTDNKTSTNAVWLSLCGGTDGQWWQYDSQTGAIYDELGSGTQGYLRTSNVKDAVYATDLNQPEAGPLYYYWYGTHD